MLQASSVNPDAVIKAAKVQLQTVCPSFVALEHLSIVEAQAVGVVRAPVEFVFP